MKHFFPQNSVFLSENLGKVSQNLGKVSQNLGKVSQNLGKVSSKSREVLPENLGKSDLISLGSLLDYFENEVEVIVDGH